MPKVSQSWGITMKIGDKDDKFQWAKVNVEVSEIDTEKPLEPQLEQTKVAIDKIYNFLITQINAQIEETLNG